MTKTYESTARSTSAHPEDLELARSLAMSTIAMKMDHDGIDPAIIRIDKVEFTIEPADDGDTLLTATYTHE